MKPFKLVIFKDDSTDAWNAQCLEVDMGAQAKTIQEVVYELQRSLVGHVFVCERLGVEPFKNVPAAPHAMWEMWKGASIKLEFQDEPFRAIARAPGRVPEFTEARLAA